MTKEKFDPNIIGEKIIKTIKTIFDPEIPSLAGVPSWMLVLLNKILKESKKEYISV